jgi:hypothetical protein
MKTKIFRAFIASFLLMVSQKVRKRSIAADSCTILCRGMVAGRLYTVSLRRIFAVLLMLLFVPIEAICFEKEPIIMRIEERNGNDEPTRMERWFAGYGSTGQYGRLPDAVAGPDGSIYVLTTNRDGRGRVRPGDDRILRITRT